MHALRTLVLAIWVAAVSCGDPEVGPTPPPTPTPSTTPTPPAPSPDFATVGAVTTRVATALRSEPNLTAPVATTLREGIILPVTDLREAFFRVLSPCEVAGWVQAAEVELHQRATGTPRRLSEATIVIDPGHGGQLPGAVGPTGLVEADPNADIAQRLVGKLGGARVFSSRADDITAGLGYRTSLANALGAHAFVSIHNNAEPDGPSERPGTETYYQSASPASKRLAGLAYEEVFRALEAFEADWVADRDAGAKYRLNTSGGDYYALLRGARVPAVIVEALFVANATEEALLRRPEVREAIAVALANGIKRYFETSDPGSGFVEPYPREPGPSGRLPTACNDPAPS
jgi:N-acetylmuramoyl-L-alanine amidase